jgi:LysM repeat protein
MSAPAPGSATTHDMGKGLKKQVGPLPLGVWIAVILGGFGIAYIINKRAGGSAPTSSPADFGSATSGTGTGSTSTWAANQPPGSPSTPMISTNVQWEQAAARYLLTLNPANGLLIDSAMRKYLFNEPLSTAESALINAAIGQFGLPPEPLPPTSDPGGGTTDPPPTGTGTTGAVPSLTATPLGNGQVRVDWTYTGTDVTSWDIGRDGTDTNGTGTWAKTGLPAGNGTWTFNILKGGTSYNFTLTGHTATGTIPAVTVSATPTGGTTGSGNGQQNQSPPPTPPPSTDPPPPPAPSVRRYTVVKGDTLWGISARYYGNGIFWRRIYNANLQLIGNPDRIYPGQVFVIP